MWLIFVQPIRLLTHLLTQYSFAFCSRLEIANNVIFGKIFGKLMGPIVRDTDVIFYDPR